MANSTSHGGGANADHAAAVDTLRAELARARANLDRLTAEYDALLADRDVIQEDRDSAGQFVEDARAVVARTETALARAEAGRYGTCARCGADIPAERLEALPDTETCVRCS